MLQCVYTVKGYAVCFTLETAKQHANSTHSLRLSVVEMQEVMKHYLDMALDDIGCRDSVCHSFNSGYKDWKAATAK